MINKNMTVAGIVLYNPSVDRLKENIDSIITQVEQLVLIDNGSKNINRAEELIKQYINVTLVRNHDNLGIARALNQIVLIAKELGASWVLTMDQDSVCKNCVIETYQKYIDLDSVASLTCRIVDRNFSYSENYVPNENYEYVESCITSGNYICIDAWKKIGGFDETFFIDKVDTDYCYRLRQAGYKIVCVPYDGLLHEVGCKTKEYSVLGKKIIVFNHSPFRVYYITRNQIYFARKHRASLGWRKAARYRRTAWTRIFVYLFLNVRDIKK